MKVEKGDLKQDGTVYPDTVRRVTLVNSSTERTFVEVFRGTSCEVKAGKWLKEQSAGAFGANVQWMWM